MLFSSNSYFQLEIRGSEYIKPHTTSHTQQGSRFEARAETTAIFDKAGNYTITCQKEGGEAYFSRSQTVLVQEETNDGKYLLEGCLLFVFKF